MAILTTWLPSGQDLPPWLAPTLLVACAAMFLLSAGAIVNPSFRDSFLRDPRYLQPGTRITKASAVISCLWWAVIGIFMAMGTFKIHSERLEAFLGPLGGFLLL